MTNKPARVGLAAMAAEQDAAIAGLEEVADAWLAHHGHTSETGALWRLLGDPLEVALYDALSRWLATRVRQ